MKINTTPRIKTLGQIKAKRERQLKGKELYEKELEEINSITDEEIAEAEKIETILNKLKKYRKKESKEKALAKKKEIIADLDETIIDMENKGIEIYNPNDYVEDEK